MPISETVAVSELPPWRRMRETGWMRFKHLFGIHTYVATLRPELEDDIVIAIRTVTECFVCDAEPGR